MSCSICHGYPGCPVCSQDSATMRCPECQGEGLTAYFNQDGEEITKEKWEQLPGKKRDQDTCPACEGNGVIEFEYEYDYDE